MPAPAASDLDYSQCIQGAYDDAKGALRVEAEIIAPIDVNGEVLVDIRASDGDSVLLAGTTNGTPTGTVQYVKVNPDGAINVDANIVSGNITLFTEPYDAITATYPTTTQEVYQSRIGGVSGTVQQTVTVNYTDTTKMYILNVART
jgi:hypothetical protein